MARKSPLHLIHDVSYRFEDGRYQMVVEIPAGENEKWQTDPVTGQFYHDQIEGKPRVIQFLPYPMNYGFIPQTLLPKHAGGDGDPLDIITLGPRKSRGPTGPVKVIGGLNLVERGETDTKIVALLPDGPFYQGTSDLHDLLMQHPKAMDIILAWFEGYKGSGAFTFHGYLSRQQAFEQIETMHCYWREEVDRRVD